MSTHCPPWMTNELMVSLERKRECTRELNVTGETQTGLITKFYNTSYVIC